MPNVNLCIQAGHLTRDPEMKTLSNGMVLAAVGIATSRKFKDKSGELREETCFLDCELWGKAAELASQYLKKGAAVMFTGRLKLDQWEDKATGAKRSKIKMVVNKMDFLGGKGEKTTKAAKPAAVAATEPVSDELDEEGIPF